MIYLSSSRPNTMNLEPSFEPYTNSQNVESFLQMQRLILDKQSRGEPFFIGRLSGNEPNLCACVISCIEMPHYLIERMMFCAGIQFNADSDVDEYVTTYRESFQSCDLVGAWSGGSMINQTQLFYDIIKCDGKWSPISAVGLEPYYYMDNPEYAYHRIFENKKVLILSSHSKTIKSQLKKLDKLFNVPIFPTSAKIFVHKPPQQNGGNHDEQSWQAHFQILQNDIKRIHDKFFPFDIALVSCGGFGMPISAFIREKMGKSVIYVGGALQLFFGVMGARWARSEAILNQVNEHWTAPLDVDKPPEPFTCENSCYW